MNAEKQTRINALMDPSGMGGSSQQSQPFSMPGGPTLQPGQSFQQSQSQSGDYFANADLVNMLAGSLGNVQNEAAAGYMDFINDPTSSPYYTNALQGLLAQLSPGENQSRMALNDQFRAGGNTSSSTYGQKAMGLESEFDRNRLGIASQLLTTLFPQVTQALYQPMSQTSQLIDALKLNQSSQSSQQGSVGFAPESNQQANAGMTRPPNTFGFGTTGNRPLPLYA